MDIRYLLESEKKQVSLKVIFKYKGFFFYQPFTEIFSQNFFFLSLVGSCFEELFKFFFVTNLDKNVHIKVDIQQTTCHLCLFYKMKETLMAQQGDRARSSSQELLKLSKSSSSR